MLRKGCQWLRREWKRLLLANIVGMILQAVVLAGLLLCGLDAIVSVVAAKVASWVCFVFQCVRGGVS